MNHPNDSQPGDLQAVISQLREHRPEATPLELDAVKRRVRARVAAQPAGRRARSTTFMKSRLAILTMLVSGMLLSTAGAGLAISGVGNDASTSQYATETPSGGGGGKVLGEENSGGGGGGGGVAGEDAQGVAGDSDEGVQPTRQVAGAGSGSLPFTGFLAIPVLLGGVALLSAGMILRRRTADDA
jgi:hypothetical protein